MIDLDNLSRAMRVSAHPPIEAEIADIIAAIEAAKSAGAYADANLLFAAALSVISRGGRDLAQLVQFCTYEVHGGSFLSPMTDGKFDAPSVENYQVTCYYDLINIHVPGTETRTCCPVPMLAPEVWSVVYSRVPTFDRGDHHREIDADRPDTWTEKAAGYKSMGEEAITWAFSEHGRREVEFLREIGRVEMPSPSGFFDD